ncbi:hypothetical protein VPNG_10175 [Cytospora leucostoma]|uniref:Uncharacterized protein n=1 Tax=Cytospora leucostoma TaxID=1230097 RepID=A0A423VFL3_9PEZI|nr:hypothetical protein VPNG_10175 [Cytospora leucostoma]
MPQDSGSATQYGSDISHASNNCSMDQVNDAVTDACEASLSSFLTKLEAELRAEIQREISDSTNEASQQYMTALRVFLSDQTLQTGSRYQGQQQKSQVFSEMLDLHGGFQQWCARQAVAREVEDAKLRVEAIYSSGILQNIVPMDQLVLDRYWNSLGMFVGLGGALATPLLPILPSRERVEFLGVARLSLDNALDARHHSTPDGCR